MYTNQKHSEKGVDGTRVRAKLRHCLPLVADLTILFCRRDLTGVLPTQSRLLHARLIFIRRWFLCQKQTKEAPAAAFRIVHGMLVGSVWLVEWNLSWMEWFIIMEWSWWNDPEWDGTSWLFSRLYEMIHTFIWFDHFCHMDGSASSWNILSTYSIISMMSWFGSLTKHNHVLDPIWFGTKRVWCREPNTT
jgi:hypothetical protein